MWGIETRDELVTRSRELAERLGFGGMRFLNLSVAESIVSPELPERIDVVTALHACNTATDDAIRFALAKRAKPSCWCRAARPRWPRRSGNTRRRPWRAPSAKSGATRSTREFGSHLTNVLRCLQLQAHGYEVTVTELTGWEHSMKNELIIAVDRKLPTKKPTERLANFSPLSASKICANGSPERCGSVARKCFGVRVIRGERHGTGGFLRH